MNNSRYLGNEIALDTYVNNNTIQDIGTGYDGSGINSGTSYLNQNSDTTIVELGPPKGIDSPVDISPIDNELGLGSGGIKAPMDAIIAEETVSNEDIKPTSSSITNSLSKSKDNFLKKLKDNSYIPLFVLSIGLTYAALKPSK